MGIGNIVICRPAGGLNVGDCRLSVHALGAYTYKRDMKVKFTNKTC